MKKLLSIIFSATTLFGAANAATIDFSGNGNITPSSITNEGTCSPGDICGTALNYDRIGLVVTSTANGVATNATLQDLTPVNAGLGVYSENERFNDEINADTNESIILTFDSERTLSNIQFNNDDHLDCPANNTVALCGEVGIIVDGQNFGSFAAVSVLTEVLTGTVFEFFALSEEGFYIGGFNVAQTPLPAAALFMVTGLAGFATSRRRKTV